MKFFLQNQLLVNYLYQQNAGDGFRIHAICNGKILIQKRTVHSATNAFMNDCFSLILPLAKSKRSSQIKVMTSLVLITVLLVLKDTHY